MIVFVPAYDEATAANLAIATALMTDDCRALVDERARREFLLPALAAPGVPLFAMTHGRPQLLRGQGGAPALVIADAASLAPRAVFAFACHTATEMGRVFAENGTDWWGYTGAISSPTTDPEILPLFLSVHSQELQPRSSKTATSGSAGPARTDV